MFVGVKQRVKTLLPPLILNPCQVHVCKQRSLSKQAVLKTKILVAELRNSKPHKLITMCAMPSMSPCPCDDY